MNFFIVNLFASNAYVDRPQGAISWFSWFVLLGINVYFLIRWRKFRNQTFQYQEILFAVLLLITPLTTMFLGVRLSAGNALPLPGTPVAPVGPAIMFLAMVPLCLAAGLLGPVHTGILALVSGGFLTLFDNHNPFLPLVYMLLAMWMSMLARQRFRTFLFKALRQPIISGMLLAVVYPFLFGLSAVMTARGELAVRMDYMLSVVDTAWLAFAGQLLWGVIFAQVVAVILGDRWYGKEALQPSPRESSLENHLMLSLLPLSFTFITIMILLLGVLLVNNSREQLSRQMEDVAQTTAAAIPFGLETGQNLISQLAEDPRLQNVNDPAALTDVLHEYLYRVPFFTQITYLDLQGEFVAGYPIQEIEYLFMTSTEEDAIELVSQGIMFQSYSLPPEPDETAGRLVFVVPVISDFQMIGVILGRSRINQNPFFIPVLQNMDTLADLGGASMLVDDAGMVLYHQETAFVGSYYEGEIDLRNPINDPQHTAPDGTREILYQEPVPGQPWVVITTMPAAVAQNDALKASLPLFGMLLVLLGGMFWMMRRLLRAVTRSISTLAEEANRIAEGDLENSLQSERVDEVGQLANALDEMRLNLKARMEEVGRLLSVSRGVASALEMEMAVTPILQGALTIGASAARLALSETAIPDYEQDMRTQFGLGEKADAYQALDQQILRLTMQQPEVILSNPNRARLENPGKLLPEAILAVALYHENVHYGALWVAFEKPHQFTEDERRFMSAVAGQAALAASNARLYLSAQLGRQRMEAIIESTTEPVLVTDYQDRLLLVNRAAQALLGQEDITLEGKLVSEAVPQPLLQELLVSKEADAEGTPPVEITFSDGRVFFGTASPVEIENKKMGRVVILRDITHYKELDALKSEFVDTVNHDLRKPLTTMRGYASMLDMVGDLNEQQTRYAGKIVDGVENMSRLINTLLDLGRIEAGVGLQLEMLPIVDVVRQVAEALRMEADQRKIDYHLHLPEKTIPLVEADQALVERAVQNLIDNAIKYSDTNGEVHVTLKQIDNGRVAIEVKDNGIGISPVDLPRLFERFYRAAGRKAVEESGIGLGLAIVKSIAERHHGSVSADSQLGKGSTFTLILPISQPKS